MLNEAARKYSSLISENETLIIVSIFYRINNCFINLIYYKQSDIEEITNSVILKTDKNESINEHLNHLIFGSNENKNSIDLKQIEENVELGSRNYKLYFPCFLYYIYILLLDSQFQSLTVCNGMSIQPGSVVYMTAFVDLNEMYVRKLEDYNEEYHNLLDKVNEFCLSGKY